MTHLKAVGVATVLAVMCSVPRDASAQATCTFTNGSPCTLSPFNVSLSPTDVLRLKLGSTTTNLGSPVKADYTTGYIASIGPTLSIKANRAYTVQIEPTTQFFCGSSCPGVASTKPASNLQWSAGGAFTSLGFGTTQTVTAAALGTPSAGNIASPQATLSFRTLLSYAVDKPGTYALVIKITLSAP